MPDENYLTGCIPFVACQHDPRVSYCLYVPSKIIKVCVYVHGTDRDVMHYRDHLADFAERTHTLIVAPLFPAGLIEPDDVDNYKFLRFYDLRFDLMLLNMLDEIGARYDAPVKQFMLGGFSGGAQFAHRFAYLHPHRVSGVSIAAPGRITLLDDAMDWWVGTRDLNTHFGQAINIEELRQVPIQLIIGADDDADITANDDIPQARIAGNTRRARLQTLYENYQQHGLSVQRDIVDDCAHDWLPLAPQTITFFETFMDAVRKKDDNSC